MRQDGETLVFRGIFTEFEPPSNWSSSPIAFNAQRYSNLEQNDALHFNDTVCTAKIIASNSPLEAFKLGKKVNMIDPITWDKNRFKVMNNLLLIKFTQNVELRL